MSDPLEQLRSGIQTAFRRTITGSDEVPPVYERTDDGLFGPDSVAWVVHGDIATLIGGLRSLFMQTLHPLATAGVVDHSNYKGDPLGRLQRTGQFVGTTTYGSTADAQQIIRMVHNIHRKVVGTAPDGRRYEANDPHLLEWVHITEVDSFLRGAISYGTTPIDRDAADRYVDEMAIVAQGLGVERPPRSVAALAQRLEDYRPELKVGSQGREIVRFLLYPDLPLAARPLHGIITAAGIGMLPGWARRMLWLPLSPGANPLVVRPAATALVKALGWALDVPDEVAEARRRLAS